MWLDPFGKLPLLIAAAFGAHIDITSIVEQNATFEAPRALVQNWRLQSIVNLDMPFPSKLLLVLGSRQIATTRCVKLNNYWCIKRAGWDGELGFDREGHVAFASASAGARAAALLLRRYYFEFGRKSAQAIVAKWAPNRCGSMVAFRPAAPAPAIDWRRLAPEQREAMVTRMLEARAKIARAQYKQRLQVVRAVNAGIVQPRPGQVKAPAVPLRNAQTVSPLSCPQEQRRIAAYALAVIRGIAHTPSEDLQLFDPNGRPTERFTKMLSNMAAVEIGPQKVEDGLVATAVAGLEPGAQEAAE